VLNNIKQSVNMLEKVMEVMRIHTVFYQLKKHSSNLTCKFLMHLRVCYI